MASIDGQRVRPGQIYKKSKLVATASGTGFSITANRAIAKLAGGNVIQEGVQDSQMTVNLTVVQGDDTASQLIEDAQNGVIFRCVYGVVGTKTISGRVMVSDINLTSTTESGEHSGSATLMVIDRKLKIS